ncbi:hypothetical protein AB0G85_35605, partial [Streptomyces sioyaensis]|uniref:hypothetical protein n=1 Tax=Streptomyces sioyaensis TaxID=67364 RepID=UPI0033D461C1
GASPSREHRLFRPAGASRGHQHLLLELVNKAIRMDDGTNTAVAVAECSAAGRVAAGLVGWLSERGRTAGRRQE